MNVSRVDNGSAAMVSEVKNSGWIDRIRATRRDPRSGDRTPPRTQLRRRSLALAVAGAALTEAIGERGNGRRSDLRLASAAEIIGAPVVCELAAEQAGEREVEMMPARTRAPFLRLVLPSTLKRIIRGVIAAYDDDFDLGGRQAGEQRGTRRLRALGGKPAPLRHALRVRQPVGLDLDPDESRCGEDGEVGQVSLTVRGEALRLVLPLQVKVVKEDRPSGVEMGPEVAPCVFAGQ